MQVRAIFGSRGASMAALCLAIVGCGGASSEAPGNSASGSYPIYASVEALALKADLVVEAVVGETISEYADRGGEPERYPDGTASLVRPMLFVRVGVAAVLRNDSNDRPSSVVIVAPDEAKVDFEEFTPLMRGQRVMLFLERIPVDDRGSLRSQLPKDVADTSVYVQLSADNGVFDVVGNALRARSPVVRGLTAAEVKAQPPPVDDKKDPPAPLTFERTAFVSVTQAQR